MGLCSLIARVGLLFFFFDYWSLWMAKKSDGYFYTKHEKSKWQITNDKKKESFTDPPLCNLLSKRVQL